MFNNTNKAVIVAAVIIVLFTPVVEWTFTIFGFVLGIFFTILGAINPLGLVVLVIGGLWVVYNRDLLSEWLSSDSEDEEDWTV